MNDNDNKIITVTKSIYISSIKRRSSNRRSIKDCLIILFFPKDTDFSKRSAFNTSLEKNGADIIEDFPPPNRHRAKSRGSN
jgi:hypothetical protein